MHSNAQFGSGVRARDRAKCHRCLGHAIDGSRYLKLGGAWMYKFCFYVPESHLEEVKAAVFAAGAGRIGHYDSCCWQTLGKGQFRPLAGSDPFLGQVDRVEEVAEWKVELVVADELIHDTVKAMKQSQPCEAPAFHGGRLADLQS